MFVEKLAGKVFYDFGEVAHCIKNSRFIPMYMQPNTKLLSIIPVLPSQDVARDVDWYRQKTGFEPVFQDNMYAVLHREHLSIHLQWHADTPEDPLLGGSVIRILVENIQPLFDEFVGRGTVSADKFIANTPWNTNEFGFYDLNNNAVFLVEGL